MRPTPSPSSGQITKQVGREWNERVKRVKEGKQASKRVVVVAHCSPIYWLLVGGGRRLWLGGGVGVA